MQLKGLPANCTYRRKKQTESDKLPPTQAALHQAILSAHFQLMVWNKDDVPYPVQPGVTGGLSMGNGGGGLGTCNDNPSTSSRGYNTIYPSASAQRSDAPPIDASAAELGFPVQTCVVVPMIVTPRISKTTTSL